MDTLNDTAGKRQAMTEEEKDRLNQLFFNGRWREFCCFVGCKEQRICWLGDPKMICLNDGWKHFSILDCAQGLGITFTDNCSCQWHGERCCNSSGEYHFRFMGSLCPTHAQHFPDTPEKPFLKAIEEADPELFNTKIPSMEILPSVSREDSGYMSIEEARKFLRRGGAA